MGRFLAACSQGNGVGVLRFPRWSGNGCIAVTDEDMAEIWQMVANGTPIEINP